MTKVVLQSRSSFNWWIVPQQKVIVFHPYKIYWYYITMLYSTLQNIFKLVWSYYTDASRKIIFITHTDVIQNNSLCHILYSHIFFVAWVGLTTLVSIHDPFSIQYICYDLLIIQIHTKTFLWRPLCIEES